jgi:hypothetical protein
MAQNKNVLIIVPAYNEENSIGKVIEDIKAHIPAADILVVNDGSLDSTSKIAKGKAVFVIDLPFNLGIGAAMQAGFKFANLGYYDIAVQCDGDGQHPPYQIKNLIAPLLENKADIVVGSRFLGNFGYRSSLSRQIGIILFSWLLSIVTKTKLTDTTCGFRAINKKTIISFSFYYPCDYPEVEALVLAHKEGLKITEIPIRIHPRKEGSSSIGFLGSFYYTVKVFLAVLIDLFETAPYKKENM